MKKLEFLNKLRKENKLELIEPSEEIKDSYLQKSDNCLRSAKVLFGSKLYENSVINCYYTMYNSILALLYKVGIKSENHTGSIILLELLFNQVELSKIVTKSKEERIDKQYYVESKEDIHLTEESTKKAINEAEDFNIKIKLLLSKLSMEEINRVRKSFGQLVV